MTSVSAGLHIIFCAGDSPQVTQIISTIIYCSIGSAQFARSIYARDHKQSVLALQSDPLGQTVRSQREAGDAAGTSSGTSMIIGLGALGSVIIRVSQAISRSAHHVNNIIVIKT